MSKERLGVPPGFVSLQEAAKRSDCSVRTVLRWIEAGLVESQPHPADRRRRIVSLASLMRVSKGARNVSPYEWNDPDWERAVDNNAVADVVMNVEHHIFFVVGELGRTMSPGDGDAHRDEDARSSFARKLSLLVDTVRGFADPNPEMLKDALHDVMRVLWTDPVTREVRVPDAFWSGSLIGRHLARARLLLIAEEELANFNEILEATRLPRRRVENILTALETERFYDPDEDRWLYPRAAITAIRRWTPDHTEIPKMGSHTPREWHVGRSLIDPTPAEDPYLENKGAVKIARNEYQRRHL